MRKFLWLWIGICLLLTGCGKQTEESGLLTGIWKPVTDGTGSEYTIESSGFWPLEDGYGCVLRESNAHNFSTDDPYWERLMVLRLDEAGEVIAEIQVPEVTGHKYITGERGIYTFDLTQNGRELFLIGWDGTIVQRADSAEFKPGSASTLTPEATTVMTAMPLAETEEGVAVVWGARCVLLDETFTETGEILLPGKGDMVFTEEDTLWLTYVEKGVRTLGRAEDGVITESWPMPESFEGVNSYYWLRLIECRDGWLYGWSETGILRWQFGAEEETIETVMDFLHSGISGQRVRMITMLPDGRFSVQMTPDNGYHIKLSLYEKAPDKDLFAMTVMTLACVQSNADLEAAVLRFNASHEDAYIKIVTYEQYNTEDEPSKGYQLLGIDLTTGLLQADILCGESYMPMDLYPLMTGEVQKEDIAPCVRRQMEAEDGALYGIGPGFRLYTTAGRTDMLNGMETWDLETFLDYAESLGDGEYMMEEVSRDSAYGKLFGGKVYEPFLQNGEASFDDPLYTRYLQYLLTLPETEQTYMNHGSNNTAALMAGEITEDQLYVEEAGENLYYNGKIRLMYTWNLNSVNGILGLCRTFGTNDITCIGYPTESESGVRVSLDYTYCIPATCKNPALAWSLIEDILLTAAEYPSVEEPDYNTLRNNTFSTLYAPYFDHLESLKGLRYFRGYDTTTAVGWDLETDVNGLLNGKPGTLQEVDADIIAMIHQLYESSGSTGMVPDEIYAIIYEEESRYLAGAVTAEQCAESVQSRVAIWLSEHE